VSSSNLRLHHGAISVRELARSIQFYERVLGYSLDTQVTSHDGVMEIAHLRRGEQYLELFNHKEPQSLPLHSEAIASDFSTIGVKHIGFSAGDPEAEHKRLFELGVDGLTPIREAKYYKFFFFKDPDGVVLEVVHRKESGVLKEIRPGLRVHHGAISVRELRRSVQFYEQVLGYSLDTQVTSHDGSMEILHLKSGDYYLELFCHKQPKPPPAYTESITSDLPVIGTKHFALSTLDPAAEHKRLSELGVNGLTPIRHKTHYDFFYFKDPDGILFKIVHHKHH
jgi:catechol 2,3-dioxygenase-like lactoylglutathione lyase family enzyme